MQAGTEVGALVHTQLKVADVPSKLIAVIVDRRCRSAVKCRNAVQQEQAVNGSLKLITECAFPRQTSTTTKELRKEVKFLEFNFPKFILIFKKFLRVSLGQ